jgi:rubrerythrin
MTWEAAQLLFNTYWPFVLGLVVIVGLWQIPLYPKLLILVTSATAWHSMEFVSVRLDARALDSRGVTTDARLETKVTRTHYTGPGMLFRMHDHLIDTAVVGFNTASGTYVSKHTELPGNVTPRLLDRQPVSVDYLPDRPDIFRFRGERPPPVPLMFWVIFAIDVALLLPLALWAWILVSSRFRVRSDTEAPQPRMQPTANHAAKVPVAMPERRTNHPQSPATAIARSALPPAAHPASRQDLGIEANVGRSDEAALQQSDRHPSRQTPPLDPSAQVKATAKPTSARLRDSVEHAANPMSLFVSCPKCKTELSEKDHHDACPACGVIFAKLLLAKSGTRTIYSVEATIRKAHFAACPKCQTTLPREKAAESCPGCGVFLQKLLA